MSYILDALRRLEQDKAEARKTSNPMETILHFNPAIGTRSGGVGTRSVWIWVVSAALLAALLAIVVTFWLTRKTAPVREAGPKTVRADRVAPTTPAAPRTSDVTPAGRDSAGMVGSLPTTNRVPSALPVKGSSSLPDSSIVSPAADFTRESAGEPSQALPSMPEETVVSGAPDHAPAGNGQAAVIEVPVQQAVETPKIRVAGSEEGLKVSAIVWSPQPERRFAVVNLKPVHPGEWVGGRQVAEILEDAVVFEGGGDKFQVKIRGR